MLLWEMLLWIFGLFRTKNTALVGKEIHRVRHTVMEGIRCA